MPYYFAAISWLKIIYDRHASLFLDGLEEDGTPFDTKILTNPLSDISESGAMWVGLSSNGSNQFIGRMQDFRFYPASLTNREIVELYSGVLPKLHVQSDCRCPPSHPRVHPLIERYCIPNAVEDTTNDRVLRLNLHTHPLSYINDQDMGTTWQSKAMTAQELEEGVTVTVELANGQYQVFYVIVQFGGLLPDSVLIQRRRLVFSEPESTMNIEQSWLDWQYMARNCNVFDMKNNGPLPRPDSVNCLQLPSNQPFSGGNITFSLLSPHPIQRPGYNDFYKTPSLQEMVQATQVRIHMRGQYRPKANRVNQLHRYFAVKEITIGGRCECHGHADHCDTSVTPYRCLCLPESHTVGSNCQRCEPLYNDKPFRSGDQLQPMNCRPCQCHGHAFSCHYDILSDDQPDEHYQGGGGVCDYCMHNTTGKNCELCTSGFFRLEDFDPTLVDVCQPCNCHTAGTVDGSTVCNQVGGLSCDRCEFGYWNLSHPDGCIPCDCDLLGSLSSFCEPEGGQCECKPGVGGRQCQPCACDPVGSASDLCHPDTGECVCKLLVTGNKCDSCQPGASHLDLENHFGCSKGFYLSSDHSMCLECDCHPMGALQHSCESQTGKCVCAHFSVRGRQCDQCHEKYFGFNPGLGKCQPCACDPVGSASDLCHPDTGECVCKLLVTGNKCDSCQPGASHLDLENHFGCSKAVGVATARLGQQLTGVSSPVRRTILGARAPSTRQQYENRWRLFSQWCSDHNKDPVSCTIPTILEFLQSLLGHTRRQLHEHQVGTFPWFSKLCAVLLSSLCRRRTSSGFHRLSHWIVDVICHAYAAGPGSLPVGLKAHSTRSVSASWAALRGVPLEAICAAASWASPSTFTRFYKVNVATPHPLGQCKWKVLVSSPRLCLEILSMTTTNRIEDKGQPWRSPTCTGNELTFVPTPSQQPAPLASALSYSSIYLSWNPPDSPNSYKLNYTLIRDGQSVHTIHSHYPFGPESFEDHKLFPFTNYSYWVLTANVAGETISASASYQTLGAPPPEDQLCLNLLGRPGPTSASFNWSTPRNDTGPVERFALSSMESSPEAEPVIHYTGLSTEAVVSSLKPFSQYTAILEACSSGGCTSSAPLSFLTAAAPPQNQPPPQINATGPHTLHASWEPPKQPNGIITRYDVFLRGPTDFNNEKKVFSSSGWLDPGDDAEGKQVNTTLSPPKNSTVVMGLQAFSTYQLRVVSINSAGSVSSEWTTARTLEGVPEFVAPPDVSALSSSSLKVTWNSTEGQGFIARGQVTEYRVNLLTEQTTNPYAPPVISQRLERTGLKDSTEALIMAAQEQTISTLAIEIGVYQTRHHPRCKLCKYAPETGQNILAGCKIQAGKAYMEHHEQAAGIVYRNICAKYGLEVPQLKLETPPKVVEKGRTKILWDFQIQTDKQVMANQLDIVVVDKREKKGVVIDVAISSNCNIRKSRRR
ncbi:usherin [Nematolebias whitei]|uniref:usherin n=1 Tax=Nematolebias whitei TaxID=451745 RepID=UPI00189A5BD9|nr:usherin [Nematolebias whitei]